MEKTVPKSKKVYLTWKQQKLRGKREKLALNNFSFILLLLIRSSPCRLKKPCTTAKFNWKINFLVIGKLQTIFFLGLSITFTRFDKRWIFSTGYRRILRLNDPWKSHITEFHILVLFFFLFRFVYIIVFFSTFFQFYWTKFIRCTKGILVSRGQRQPRPSTKTTTWTQKLWP